MDELDPVPGIHGMGSRVGSAVAWQPMTPERTGGLAPAPGTNPFTAPPATNIAPAFFTLFVIPTAYMLLVGRRKEVKRVGKPTHAEVPDAAGGE